MATPLHREEQIRNIRRHGERFDIIVIGGGATGVGIALDAALRGYSTALFEASDFGKGTSSRSTKLVHGGVRYLEQGHVGLVREALRERALLRRNAPGLVRRLNFVLPLYRWWERVYYGTGLFLYDRLASEHGDFERTQWLSARSVVSRVPPLRARGLRGAWVYQDGQFDDARLLIELARAAVNAGAHLVNYARVSGLLPGAGGVAVTDVETGDAFEVPARVVVNATGAFVDEVRAMAGVQDGMVSPSQGTHVVVDRRFFPGDDALIVPRTPDGRVVFVIPWHGSALIGTTDVAVHSAEAEPKPTRAEIEFLLDTAGEYLESRPRVDDVLSTWAGIRPLVRKGTANTAALSRDHTITVERGLVTITGGKWTTFRRMAEDAVNRAAAVAGLPPRQCRTESLRIEAVPDGQDEVVRAARQEMARTVEDVLARRTRLLFLNARAAMDAAPTVASVLARELGRDAAWQRDQVSEFSQLARGYLAGGALTPAAAK